MYYPNRHQKGWKRPLPHRFRVRKAPNPSSCASTGTSAMLLQCHPPSRSLRAHVLCCKPPFYPTLKRVEIPENVFEQGFQGLQMIYGDPMQATSLPGLAVRWSLILSPRPRCATTNCSEANTSGKRCAKCLILSSIAGCMGFKWL